MKNHDKVEFYNVDKLVAVVKSSMVPTTELKKVDWADIC